MGPDRFRSTVLLIVLIFVALQVVYAQQIALVMDEFDGAYEAYRLRTDVPYRDFVPYKTVLGYYFQLPATFLSATVWGRLLALKGQLIATNALMLVAAAFYCSRFLGRRAVALALGLLAASTVMTERAGEIRVDMLTAWAGLWSFLFLLQRRYATAGLLCALSFAISQKAALYVVASNVALLAAVIYDRDRPSLRALLIFNSAAAAGLAGYLAFWSMLGDPMTVLRSTFLSASQTAVTAAYDIQWRFWSQVLARNFAIFILSAAALWTLLRRGTDSTMRPIAVYSAVLLFLCAIYTQPWPYFFVILFPTLFVLIAAWFTRFEHRQFPRSLLAASVLFGVIYPLYRPFVVLQRSNDYQRYNVALASALLAPRETYLAANDIIHDREQTLRRLSRLDAIGLRMLEEEGPHHHRRLIADLDRAPSKLVIGNYRIYSLPGTLRTYIEERYAPLSGSIRLYAPLLAPGDREVNLRFAGRYRVEVQSGAAAVVDGRQVANGSLLDLVIGTHRVSTRAPTRLRLLPAGVEAVIEPHYAEERPFYPPVYD